MPQNSRQAFLKMEEKRTECAPKCCPETWIQPESYRAMPGSFLFVGICACFAGGVKESKGGSLLSNRQKSRIDVWWGMMMSRHHSKRHVIVDSDLPLLSIASDRTSISFSKEKNNTNNLFTTREKQDFSRSGKGMTCLPGSPIAPDLY